MKNHKLFLSIIIFLLFIAKEADSYSPKGRDFGLGIILGEPTGLSAKYWTARNNALAFSLGNSYLGRLRLGADYLWHMNAFNSNIVHVYAGPGLAIGIGGSGGWLYRGKDKVWYRTDDESGFGLRGVFGIDVVPRNSPVEIFGEVGVLIGLTYGGFMTIEGAIGFRYYF